MPTKPSFIDFLLDQLAETGAVSAKKMFGEYGLFLSGRMIGIVGENQLYFKPTDAGRKLLPQVVEVAPYPGAKPCFLVGEEDLENREWLCEVAMATALALPLPVKKPKQPRVSKRPGQA